MSTKMGISIMASLLLACMSAPHAVAAPAKLVHVSIAGSDKNPGTADKPLASMKKALALVKGHAGPADIVIHEGVYRDLEYRAGPKKGFVAVNGGKQQPLTVRAALRKDGAYEDVVFDGARPISEAEPVAGAPGVFRIRERLWNYQWRPQMWERDTRKRYVLVADLDAVREYPASFWYTSDEVFFHTSDNRAPKHHDMGVVKWGRGFVIGSDVTLRGIQFRNFGFAAYSGAVTIYGSRVTIEDCRASNCFVGFQVLGSSPSGVVIRRCRTDDCAGGVYTHGKHVIVEDCRLFKTRDDFMFPAYCQNDCGIQYYYPAWEGEVRRNLIVGFLRGIFLKCKVSRFLVERNTCVKIGQWGFGCTAYHPESIFRRNIVTDASCPFFNVRNIKMTTVADYNCFWDARDGTAAKDCMEIPRRFSAGAHTIYADPVFVAPEAGDYRLAPGSPCAKMGASGEPCGALGVAGADFRDVQPPRVALAASEPARQAGGSGKLYFDRDPWLGGGRGFVRELPRAGETATWLTPNAQVTLSIAAEDSAGRATQMKLKIGEGEWSAPEPVEAKKKITLPEGRPVTPVSVVVCDNAGNWSEPASLSFVVASQGPKLRLQPTVYANDQGAIISFKTDRPCAATVEYGLDARYGSSFSLPELSTRDWTASDGGEWVEIRKNVRVQQHLALITPKVERARTYHYRLILRDEIENKTVTEDRVFTVAGKAAAWYVSKNGVDEDGRGTKGSPWRTPQFAVDRALPGDRVVLFPGVYGGRTILRHGGVPGAPITVEAAERRQAVLDGRKDKTTLLQLEKAPHVVIDGLEVRWFQSKGISVYDSPNVTVKNCTVWNDFWGGRVDGYGVFAHRSPGFVADHNVIARTDTSMFVLCSPRSRVTYNTLIGSVHGGAGFDFSLAGTVVRNNSFAFNGGIALFGAQAESKDATATFDCDYNNLGVRMRNLDDKARQRILERQGHRVPKKRLQLAPKRAPLKGAVSKWFITLDGIRYYSFKNWQTHSGKGQHSIFADPKYVDALNMDFRLCPDSPNIGVGENGTTIGALGVKKD